MGALLDWHLCSNGPGPCQCHAQYKASVSVPDSSGPERYVPKLLPLTAWIQVKKIRKKWIIVILPLVKSLYLICSHSILVKMPKYVHFQIYLLSLLKPYQRPVIVHFESRIKLKFKLVLSGFFHSLSLSSQIFSVICAICPRVFIFNF